MLRTTIVGPDDWHVWRELRRAALADAPYAFGSTLTEWSGAGDTEQRWRERLAGVPFNVVLFLDDVPVGMVSATGPGADGSIELISLWVAPDARGHGVGDEAVRAVIAWANSTYPDSAVALSVKIGNQAAQRLYRRHGFHDFGPSPDDPAERLMHR